MPRFQLGRAKNSSQCRRVRPKRTSIRPKLTSCTSSDKSFSPAACRSRLRTRGGLPEEALVVWRRKSGNGAPAGVVVHAAAGRHVGWHRPGSRGNRPKPRNFPCPESARAVLPLVGRGIRAGRCARAPAPAPCRGRRPRWCLPSRPRRSQQTSCRSTGTMIRRGYDAGIKIHARCGAAGGRVV